MILLEIGVVGLVLIAVATMGSHRIGVASPLILLAFGVGIGLLPFVPAVEVAPEIILEGILPPLLFATALKMSFIDFSRELFPVAVLAIALVVFSSVAIGVVVTLLVPSLSLSWAIALGAILSPTDAVAVSIARKTGLSARVITMLEGEGLLNDATALVALTTAVSIASAEDEAALSAAGIVLSFLQALVVAIIVGWAVGTASTIVRARIDDPAVDTTLTFAIPFIAAIPAEHLRGSGLVAAVVAGLVAGNKGLRVLPAENRFNGHRNWNTVELILEGAIFLVMGLQMPGIVEQVIKSPLSVWGAAGASVILGVLALVCRALIVWPMISYLKHRTQTRAERWEQFTSTVEEFEKHLGEIADGVIDDDYFNACELRELNARERRNYKRRFDRFNRRRDKVDPERIESRMEKVRADIDYFCAEELGHRDAAVIVWAGMRGAVTLAAAQTLPVDAPARAFLVLVAVFVAAGSLVIQGITLNTLIRWVKPRMASEPDHEEGENLIRVLHDAAAEAVDGERGGVAALRASGAGLAPVNGAEIIRAGEPITGDMSGLVSATRRAMAQVDREEMIRVGLKALSLQRNALLDVRKRGLYSTTTIEHAMDRLDQEEIVLKRMARKNA